MSSFKDQISPGDDVFIWKSGAGAGIVAKATVLTKAEMVGQTEEERHFALQKKRFEGSQLRARIRIDAVIDPPLSRELLLADPLLSDLSILKFPRGTNFAVTAEQAAAIDELLEAGQGDADEIVALSEHDRPDRTSRVWVYAGTPKLVKNHVISTDHRFLPAWLFNGADPPGTPNFVKSRHS